MRIISRKRINDFIELHPNSKVPLTKWYRTSKKANWETFADIKQAFNSVDYVGNKRYVFNIGGNNYRLVAIVLLGEKRIYIRFIGTHSEYDKIDCSKI